MFARRYRASKIISTAAALLLGTASLVHAQIAPPDADRLVSDTEATHIANLAATGGTAGRATAWFWADPQNNTLRWTIEFDRFNVAGAEISCRTSKVGQAPADARPPAVAPVREMTAAIERVPVPGAPTPNDGGGAEGADLRVVLDLFEGVPPALNLQSPFEGEVAGLDDPIFDEIEAGNCFLAIQIVGATTPAG